MDHMVTVLGGNVLRESGRCQRSCREGMAMPPYLNAQSRRVCNCVGRLLLAARRNARTESPAARAPVSGRSPPLTRSRPASFAR